MRDHITVMEDAVAQLPAELIETIEILVRADGAGATHEVIDFCREHRLRYSVGFELTEQVRAAILKISEDAWIAALASDGTPRENGQIAEITKDLDLTRVADRLSGDRRRERAIPARSCRSPTTTATASKPS